MSRQQGPKKPPPATAEDWNRAQGVGRVEFPNPSTAKMDWPNPGAAPSLLSLDGQAALAFACSAKPVRGRVPLRTQFPDGVTRGKLLLALESAAGDVVKRSISPGKPWPRDLEELRQVVDWLYEFDMRVQEEEASA